MNTLDIVFAGIMVVSLAVSAFRGGIRELFSILAILVGFVTASRYYGIPETYMVRLTSHDSVNNIIGFILVFLFIAMLTSFVGGQLTQIVKKADLGFWNLMAGTAIGAIRGILVCALLTYALLVFMEPGSDLFSTSRAFPYMSQVTQAVSPMGPRHFREGLTSKLESLAKRAVKSTAGATDEKPKPGKKAGN